MTIELKQAAQQAVDAFDAFGEDDDFASLFELTRKMRALCTAIQQAEAQQPTTAIACGIPGMAKTTCPYCEQGFAFEHEHPATTEPVAWNSIQIASWIGSQLMHEPSMFERATVCKFVRSLGRHPTLLKHSPKIHQAPSVPADVVRDAERYRFIRDADVSDDLIPDIALYAMESLDEYIDAAMLAAKKPSA